MRIAIIGAGNVGSALGGSLARAGHQITLAARDVADARQVAERIGVSSAATPAEAASDAEVVVLAVPFGAAEAVAAEVASAAPDPVIVDATNPIKPDYSGLVSAGGPSGAERVAAAAHSTRVVKAFNTVFAGLQAESGTLDGPIDVLLAGDDRDAKATVAALVNSIDARPIDAGPLTAATSLEAMAWLNIQLQLRTGGDWRSTFVLVGAPEAAVLDDVRERALVS